MKRSPLLLTAFALVACGGPDPASEASNIDGYWDFTWSEMRGVVDNTAVECQQTIPFHILQSGNTFSGLQSAPSDYTCTANGHVFLDGSSEGEKIVGGLIDGNQVVFKLDELGGDHTGIVNKLAMTGTGTWDIIQTVGGISVLTGKWVATPRH